MNPQSVLTDLPASAVFLANHVWQSTVFAFVAGLLTLCLRRNRAEIRYRLWLAASVKFLVPLSVLVECGSWIGRLRHSVAVEPPWYYAMQRASVPFLKGAGTLVSQTTSGASSASPFNFLPLILATWLCGIVIVSLAYWARWRRVLAASRLAAELHKGRELVILRHLEAELGIATPVELLLSPNGSEPGIFGILRPRLLWPQGISERMDDAHIEAVILHELLHVLRRDNRAALVHMVVQSLFWFHPLIWWMGNRLVQERERACDEEVLLRGGDRRIYAESILRVCEFCVASPLASVSGVTGADLKERIARILSGQIVPKLNFGRKILLWSVGGAVIAFPIWFGLVHANPILAHSQKGLPETTARYEAISIKLNKEGTAALKTGEGVIYQSMLSKPDSFSAKNTSVQELVRLAFQVHDYQIVGAPSWFTSDLYDVEAKIGKTALDERQNLSAEERETRHRNMSQELIERGFKLKFHREIRELPSYSLVVTEPGKLHEGTENCDPHAFTIFAPGDPPPPPSCESVRVSVAEGRMDGRKVPMSELVASLSDQTGRKVSDNTNIYGEYDLNIEWRPEQSDFAKLPASLRNLYLSDKSIWKRPPLIQAIQEQLGLRLQPEPANVEVFVIDHVERPVEN
jgi:bla regulator protein blaR1